MRRRPLLCSPTLLIALLIASLTGCTAFNDPDDFQADASEDTSDNRSACEAHCDHILDACEEVSLDFARDECVDECSDEAVATEVFCQHYENFDETNVRLGRMQCELIFDDESLCHEEGFGWLIEEITLENLGKNNPRALVEVSNYVGDQMPLDNLWVVVIPEIEGTTAAFAAHLTEAVNQGAVRQPDGPLTELATVFGVNDILYTSEEPYLVIPVNLSDQAVLPKDIKSVSVYIIWYEIETDEDGEPDLEATAETLIGIAKTPSALDDLDPFDPFDTRLIERPLVETLILHPNSSACLLDNGVLKGEELESCKASLGDPNEMVFAPGPGPLRVSEVGRAAGEQTFVEIYHPMPPNGTTPDPVGFGGWLLVVNDGAPIPLRDTNDAGINSLAAGAVYTAVFPTDFLSQSGRLQLIRPDMFVDLVEWSNNVSSSVCRCGDLSASDWGGSEFGPCTATQHDPPDNPLDNPLMNNCSN